MSKRNHIVIDARIRRTSTGRYIDRLVEHLQNVDSYHTYTILVEPDDPWQPRSKNFKAMPCRYAQFSFNPAEQFGFAWQLYKLRPNLVHFPMSQQPLLYFGNIVTTAQDTTMYRFVRRGTTPMPVYKLKMALYRFLVWFSHRKSRYILTPSQTVAKEFAELQPFTSKKTAVTYEASEPPLPNRSVKPKMVDGDFILYVGSAFPHKNLPKLVEAFDILHEKNPRLKLVLTGKREKHYEELETWAAKRPSYSHIVFTGFVTDPELKWLYEHCQAYVFASLSEGFGLPPLEAMAHGAPVASSNSSCMPEIYGDAAEYFNAEKAEDIAEKVSKVLGSKTLREKLIANGYRRLKQFSWQRMADETLTVYKAALREEPKEKTVEPGL
ncbi:MAG TPA: glycosyltransferase family 1 protein [Candidatus Saccharimonadales bacterium]|nr:glycosyltransferase family 1 protein [Candidatus Saccharimonadales bacterium]